MFPYLGMANFSHFTVSMWVKLDGYAGWYDHGENFISFRKPCGNTLYIGFGGTPWSFFYGTQNRTISIPSAGSWQNWTLHTLVFDNGTLRAYKNGQLGGETNGATVEAESEGGMGIHWFCSGGTESTRFIGGIDDVRVYNRALTASEVWELYSGEPPAGDSAIGISSARLMPDGSKRVEVRYTLQQYANVSVELSENGGATWYTPSGGDLSGTYGNGLAAGSHTLYWDASGLPSNTRNNNMRVRLTAHMGWGTVYKVASFVIDFASSQNVQVRGKVRDATSRAPVSGAQIGLDGQSTSTGSDGSFVLSGIDLLADHSLLAQKTGYAASEVNVVAALGAKQIVIPDILLRPSGTISTNEPGITSLSLNPSGLLLSNLPIPMFCVAKIDWNGLPPGPVRFFAGNLPIGEVSGVTNPASIITMPYLLTAVSPLLGDKGNSIGVEAESATGVRSARLYEPFAYLPLPQWSMQLLPWLEIQQSGDEVVIACDVEIPPVPINSKVSLGPLGQFGCDLGANLSFDYTVTDGDWEIELGLSENFKRGKRGRRPVLPGLTRKPKLKLYFGNKEIGGKIAGGARGNASLEHGLVVEEFYVTAGLNARVELGRVSPFDVAPGLSSVMGYIPGLADAMKPVSIIIYLKGGLEGTMTDAIDPVTYAITMKSCELEGKIGLEAAYEPDLLICKLKASVGGDVTATIGTPGAFFRRLNVKSAAEFSFETWLITFGPYEFVILDLDLYNATGLASMRPLNSEGVYTDGSVVLLSSRTTGGAHPISRAYRDRDSDLFALSGRSLSSPATAGALDAFRQIGLAPVRGSVQWLSRPPTSLLQSRAPAPIGTTPVFQADLPLVENVFPYSEPSMAGVSSNLMLLYVTDNGYSNDLQFTDIKWSRFDGWDWSVPQTILADTRAEFGPRVKFDGNGDAVAVWQRVTDPNFTNVDLTAMAAEMEIVFSQWDSGSGAWSTPVAMTTNAVYDGMPMLAGPMANGDVLLAWMRNEANLLMGTGTVGAASNDKILWSRWSASSQTWSAASVLLSNITGRTSQDFAGANDTAVLVWSADMDGVMTNDADMELFAMVRSNGAWGSSFRYTTNAVPDRTVRAAVSASGVPHLVWRMHSNLVSAASFSTNRLLARANSDTAGFADYAMTYGPQGNIALIWQEMSEAGSDAHYAVYDPASGSWSQDMRLFTNSTLERSFAPVWDNVGNLTIAYNAVEMYMTNKTIELEGGGFVTVSNVPESGAVGLAVVKRALIQDVALLEGDFTVDGYNYLPFDALTLSARLRNMGDVAVTNPAVAFYNGDPAQGGLLIGTVSWSNGWYEGGSTGAVLSTVWVVPEPATNRTLYAVANPTGAFTEFSRLNNTQKVAIGGTDLSVSLVSATTESNGSMRVIAQVRNEGAPDAGVTTLAIRREGATGAALGTAEVPALEPGRLAQVAVDLPAGTVPERDSVFTLFADDTGAVAGDVDTNNNVSSFSVHLWLDADGDGIPDWWEVEQFQGATNATAGADADGDGMDNWSEYRAGTDPHDEHSYLATQDFTLPSGASGIEIRWGSVSNKVYGIQRAVDLMRTNAFETAVSGIVGTPPENVYQLTTPTNRWFIYRVIVQ